MPIFNTLSEEKKKKQLQQNDTAAYSQPDTKAQAEPAANTNGNSADIPEQKTTANTPGYAYDPSTNDAYQQALAALQAAQKETPAYSGTYDGQLQELYNQIVNRDKFKYDLNADALYQQYKDQYINQGQLAMMDTMGQAASLTGGYGSSYGQSVGQQTYQQYLRGLNDKIPELYGLALDQYNQEGQQLQNQYAMLGDLRDEEYGRYQDALTEYWRNLDYLQGQADSEYNRGYENWYNAYVMENDAKNTAYNRLIDLMSSSGYMPTEQELTAAGMTQQQAESFINAWKAENPDLAYRTGVITPDEYMQMTGEYPEGYTPPSSGGSGYGSNYNSETADIQKQLNAMGANLTVDGIWGPKTEAAYNAIYGNNNPDDTPTYGFTGSTYSEAVAYMKQNGVPSVDASAVMTENEWRRRKASYNNYGTGGAEVKNYNSYKEYLADYVEYATSK